MNTSYFPSPKNQPRLHSPLLDGKKNEKVAIVKGKKTYFNPQEENKKQENIDETLDSTIFSPKNKTTILKQYELVNNNLIDLLETFFKIASILILALGGILCILELINISRIIYSGSYNFGNNLFIFAGAFIGTVVSNVICLGFAHVIRSIKHIYLNIEDQNAKLDKFLSIYNK